MNPAQLAAIAAAVKLLKSHGFQAVPGTEGMCWFETKDGWVITLSETGYTLHADGRLENSGPFENLEDELTVHDDDGMED